MRDSVRDSVAAEESHEKDLEGSRWKLRWRGGGAAWCLFKQAEAEIRAVRTARFSVVRVGGQVAAYAPVTERLTKRYHSSQSETKNVEFFERKEGGGEEIGERRCRRSVSITATCPQSRLRRDGGSC